VCEGERDAADEIVRTAYYIAFGAHGPRALPPPGEGWKVAGYTVIGVAVSFALFAGIRMGAKGSPGTMNKEYQEATNEYLKVWLLSFFSLGSCAGGWERGGERRIGMGMGMGIGMGES
jgi:Cytochrome c oxidase subunit IV